MLVQAAQQVGIVSGPLGLFFRRLGPQEEPQCSRRRHRTQADAFARHMLMNNEPYRYAQPKTMEAQNSSRLRIRATGRENKGGTPKGQPRSAAYGLRRTHTVRCLQLNTIYAQEQLPPPQRRSPPANKSMLARHQLNYYAHSIRRAQRVPRRSRT